MRAALAASVLALAACSTPVTHVDAGTCLSDRDCPSTHHLCDHAHLRCVDCLSDMDCFVGQTCTLSACVATGPCTSSADCPSGVCDIAAGHCVACLAETDCAPGELCAANACISEAACTPTEELVVRATGCTTLDIPATGTASCGGIGGTVVHVKRTTTQPWALSLCAETGNLCVGAATVDTDRCVCTASSACMTGSGTGTLCTGWPLSSLSTAEHLVVGASTSGMVHLTLCSPPDHTVPGM